VVVYGLSRTRLDTVLELLPRAPPAQYSAVELIEFERRLANLAIFDLVRVTRMKSHKAAPVEGLEFLTGVYSMLEAGSDTLLMLPTAETRRSCTR
jgi:hypothetical protein